MSTVSLFPEFHDQETFHASGAVACGATRQFPPHAQHPRPHGRAGVFYPLAPADARQKEEPVTTILLCAENILIRKGLRKILEDDDSLSVVAETGALSEVLTLAERHRPDVAFVELDMPYGEGLRMSHALSKDGEAPSTGLAFLTQSFDPTVALRGLLAGARAFLAKSDPPRHLVAAVHAVAAGYTVLPPDTVSALEPWGALSLSTTRVSDMFGTLTTRELEVLRLIAAGMANREIAKTLSLGEATVKSHVSRLLSKLGLRNRSQAVAQAYAGGLISAPSVYAGT